MAGDTFDAGTVYAGARLDRDEFQRDLKAIRADLAKFERQQFRVPVRIDIERELVRARNRLGQFTRQSAEMKVALTLDDTKARGQYASFKSSMTDTRVKLDLDTSPADQQYAAFKSAMGPIVVPVELDTKRAEADLRSFQSRARGKSRFRFNIDLDIGAAMSKLASLYSMFQRVASMRARPHIDVDVSAAIGNIAKVSAAILGLGGLAGVIGGLAGALGGVGAAGAVAAAGVVPMIMAFLGVGKALSAMSQAQESAATEAASSAKQQMAAAFQVGSAQIGLKNAVVSAAKARRDATRSVSQAEQQASRAIESALQQQDSAQRQLASAQRAARMAQSELTRAWEEGKRALQDLQDQLDMSVLDREQATFDLRDAEKDLAEARRKGNADEIARADLAVRRQIENIDQIDKRNQRLQADNAKGQKAGIAGTEQYQAAVQGVQSAEEAVGDARRQAEQASREVDRARMDGIAAVAEAREQAQDRIAQADQQVFEAQRQLNQAMSQMGQIGTGSADKVAQAFANLSPAAAEFARYLFGLKPVLQELSGIAATAFFPPLTQGINTLLTKLPEARTVIGQLAGGMGEGLKLVLTQLANPFWSSFFALLGNSAGTVIPMLFGTLMDVARALATVVTHLLPLAPAGLQTVSMLADLLGYLSPFLAVLLGGTIPAAQAFLLALRPLGPVMAALAPILNVLGVALSQILGAALTALAPILVALTPFIEAFAVSLATSLVGAIQSLTPFLVGFATWMSENPGLVMGLIGAVLAAIPIFNALGAVFSMLFTPIAALRLVMLLTGLSIGSLLAPLALAQAWLGKLLAPVLRAISVSGVFSTMMRLAGQGLMFLGRAVLTALGPVGWLLLALGAAYATSAPFRDAINQIFGILGQLVGMLVGAVMPIFNALAGVFSMLAGVVGQVVGALAVALVPVLNLFAGILMQLVGALLPPLMSIIGALVPVITMLGGVFVQLVSGALMPLIELFAKLLSAVLPPLISILQSVVIPVITFLANVISTVLVWVINNVLIPAIQSIVPFFQMLGDAAMWLWTNAIKPAFDFIATAAKVLFAIIMTVLITPLLIAWNLVSAAAMWLWENGIRPAFQAIGDFVGWVWTNLLKPAFDNLMLIWDAVSIAAEVLYNTYIKPIFEAIGMFVDWIWVNMLKPAFDNLMLIWAAVQFAAGVLYNTYIKPLFTAIGEVIKFVWEEVIRPAFEAVVGGLNWLGENFVRVTDWIRDIWAKIKGFLAKPINFMIDTVWNNGVVPAWNAVASLVGLGPIDKLPLIPEAARGGVPYPDRYTPGKDIGLAHVSGGEAVMRPEWTRVMGSDYISQANAAARVGGTHGVAEFLNTTGTRPAAEGRTKRSLMTRVPGLDDTMGARPAKHPWMGSFAYGGVVPHVAFAGDEVQRILGRMPGGVGGVGGRGNASDHPSGHALDFMTMRDSGLGDRVARHLEANAERLAVKYIIWKQQINQGRGWSGMEDRGSITANHFDHVHTSFEGGPLGGAWGDGPEGGGGLFNWILDKMRSTFDALTNPALAALGGLVGAPPPEWRRVPVAMGTKMRDTVRDFIFGKADAGGGMDVSGISGPVVEQVRQVAHRFGWGAGPQWDALAQLIQKESSWNPNAANPRSSARGLFQKMTSIHGPVEPTAAGQAAWGLNYIRERYNDPIGAWGFHRRNNYYDQGGELRRGATMVNNMLPHAETVVPLPPMLVDNLLKMGGAQSIVPIVVDSARVGRNMDDRTGDEDSLIRLARAIATEVRDQAPLVGSMEVPTHENVSARDVADEVVFRLRSVKRGGVYAGRTS